MISAGSCFHDCFSKWAEILPHNADPRRSYGNRVLKEIRLNHSFDQTLIELRRMISTSEEREVHLGWQKVLERSVEVHRMNEVSQEDRMRFLAESHALSQVEHPGVMPIHDRGDDYMALRKSPKRTFADLIPAGGLEFVPLIDAIEYISRVVDTMSYSHLRGIIHGDIQPHHIAIGEHGEVLLQGWHLSALIDELLDVAGTPAWIAPEAAAGQYAGGPVTYFKLRPS